MKPRARPAFRLLGDLEVGDGAVALGGPKQRALLAYLLLHADRVVPTDRLVDVLWGDPPPATASAVVHSYVGKLRRALSGTGTSIVTRSPGYVLALNGADLDVTRFEELAKEGKRGLEEGDAERARGLLHEAIELWRGPALADLVYEPSTEKERSRLEKLRLEATLDRLEADLALGRSSELVVELESLVRDNPFSERPRAQLMLALYRAGRPDEALAVYRDGCTALRDELGLEPGRSLQALERAILNQDPALESPRPRKPDAVSKESPSAGILRGLGQRFRRNQSERTARKRIGLLVAALVALAAAAASGILVVTTGGSAPRIAAQSVAVLDAQSGAVQHDIRLGGSPTGAAFGYGSLWVADGSDSTLIRIDPTRAVVTKTVGLPGQPSRVATGAGAVWVLLNDALVRVDPATTEVVGRIKLPRRPGGQFVGQGLDGLAVGAGSVWVASLDFQLLRIDPGDNRVVRTYELDASAGPLVYGGGAVWVESADKDDSSITRFNPAIGSSTRTSVGDLSGANLTVGEPLPWGQMAFGEGGVWVPASPGGMVWRLDPVNGRVDAIIRVGRGPTSVAAGANSIWVANATADTASRIDPNRNAVVRTIPLRGSVAAMAIGRSRLWLALR